MADSAIEDILDSTSTPASARRSIRAGRWQRHTAGVLPGYVQGNVVVLPREHAADFLCFCQRNPKPCPLLSVSEPGETTLPGLGDDLDIRRDVPRYRVFRSGEFDAETTDITSLWRDDFVTFVLGCSFTFEAALIDAGVPLRHVREGKNVSMYRSTLATSPAGPFSGNMVVSMRPLLARDAIRAIQITSRFPAVHGAPVHLGDPTLIGVQDLSRPDFGDCVDVLPGELPVFWACGVTPQVAIENARPEICITHAPGFMLITDLTHSALATC